MSKATSLLRDLQLEIADQGQTKLLLIIAAPAQEYQLQQQLGKTCRDSGIKVREIEAWRLIPAKLFSALLDLINSPGSDVLSITNISALPPPDRIAFFNALNFQRDSIMRLGRPLLFWLPLEGTFELAKSAPDFWSRRTAVYHFDETPAQSLIARLFRDSPIPRETYAGGSGLAECLEILLQKEDQLRKLVKPQSELDVSRAKECQQWLLGAADQLLKATKGGKELELAYCLWNLSDIDSMLQSWLSNLNRRDRSLFGELYTDRNEVLLALAGDLKNTIKRYKANIIRDLGRLKAMSLLALFRDRANVYLNYAARKLARLALESPSDMDMFGTGGDDEFEQPYDDWRAIDSEAAAQDLESWLSGRNEARPIYLSNDEGALLKELYLGKPVFGRAARFNKSERQISQKVKDLERKLRFRLGVSSRDIRDQLSDRIVRLDAHDEETGVSPDLYDSTELTVEQRLLRDEQMAAIRRQVMTLPELERTAVLMHKYQGMNYHQIGDVLKMNESATKSLLSRAYRTLRGKLKDFR